MLSKINSIIFSWNLSSASNLWDEIKWHTRADFSWIISRYKVATKKQLPCRVIYLSQVKESSQ